MPRCTYTKPNGEQCKLFTGGASEFCHKHIDVSVKKAEASGSGGAAPEISINEESLSGLQDVAMSSLPASPAASTRSRPSAPGLEELMARLVTLELENKSLKMKLMKAKTSAVEYNAKLLFYHDNKKRSDIISTLVDRIQKADAVIVQKNGKVHVPWRFVKACTDHVWAEVEESVREKYRAMALEKIVAK
jgi:hypothetical protein